MCLGVPGIIQSVTDEWNAIVDVNGVQRTVNIAYLSEEEKSNLVNQWVLVHVGFAMAVIDADDAVASLKLLAELS